METLSALLTLVALLSATPDEVPRVTPELAGERVGAVVPEVERIRGLSFKRQVPVEVIDDVAAREHILSRLERFDVGDEIATAQEAWRLLGLVRADEDILALFLAAMDEQAGGFYDPEAQRFYLLDDMPASAVEVLTAHELTHALDDQHFDLDRQIAEVIDDDDRSFARGCLHEGSATLAMSVYAARSMISGALSLEALGNIERDLGPGVALDALPAILLRQMMGPYVLGAGFLARGDLTSAMVHGFPVADVNQVFADPPVSSEQILHPEKYWDRRDDPTPIDLAGAGAALGGRFVRVGDGVLGEVTLALMTGAATPTAPEELLARGGAAWTNEAASGWDGDRWELWRRGAEAVVLLLTIWDSEEDARQFERAVDGHPGLRTGRRGARVAIVAGRAGKRSSRLVEALLEASRAGMVE